MVLGLLILYTQINLLLYMSGDFLIFLFRLQAKRLFLLNDHNLSSVIFIFIIHNGDSFIFTHQIYKEMLKLVNITSKSTS